MAAVGWKAAWRASPGSSPASSWWRRLPPCSPICTRWRARGCGSSSRLAPVQRNAEAAQRLALEVVGNDRPGIVRDVARVLAEHGVNIEELTTGVVSGSFSGETLFRATAFVARPGRRRGGGHPRGTGISRQRNDGRYSDRRRMPRRRPEPAHDRATRIASSASSGSIANARNATSRGNPARASTPSSRFRSGSALRNGPIRRLRARISAETSSLSSLSGSTARAWSGIDALGHQPLVIARRDRPLSASPRARVSANAASFSRPSSTRRAMMPATAALAAAACSPTSSRPAAWRAHGRCAGAAPAAGRPRWSHSGRGSSAPPRATRLRPAADAGVPGHAATMPRRAGQGRRCHIRVATFDIARQAGERCSLPWSPPRMVAGG